MKYLAVASFAALAVATPALEARDWNAAPVKVDPVTWAPVPVVTKKPEPATWYPIGHDGKKPDPAVWDEWNKKPVYTTTVVTAVTTYCPYATTLVHAGKTYTITKATTLTIVDCPCTISVPVYVKTTTSCDYKPAPVTWADSPAKTPVKGADTWVDVPAKTPVKGADTWVDVPAKTPVKGADTWVDVPAPKTPGWTDVPAKTATATGWSPVATWKGAADKVNVGAGAGLAGVVGLAALLL